MVLCHETCPFGLVWKGLREPRCGGCWAEAAACRCHDESMLHFTMLTLRNTGVELAGWVAVGQRGMRRVRTAVRPGTGPRWSAVSGQGAAA